MSQLKPSLMDYTLKELATQVKPAFRAKQIYSWLYQCNINQPPQLSPQGRDVDHFFQRCFECNVLNALKPSKTNTSNRPHLED